ncbi:MAG TPA: hypothetical protein VF507_10965, partial [Pyrinomonadaceae bacterium]
MNDYLWDKSGEADPEVLELERTLGQLRHRRQEPPALPLIARHAAPNARPRLRFLAIAAALILTLLAGGLWVALRRNDARPSAGTD